MEFTKNKIIIDKYYLLISIYIILSFMFIFREDERKKNQFSIKCGEFSENIEIEKELKMVNIKKYKSNERFNMNVYKINDVVSQNLIVHGAWEEFTIQSILDGLESYKIKNGIKKNEDVTFIDVGANIGAISFQIALYNYKVIGFEPYYKNVYILQKNYCLNEDRISENFELIDKGLFDNKGYCLPKVSKDNVGDMYLECKENKIEVENKNDIIELNKLDYYYKYYKDRKIGVIKMDIEGSEPKAVEGGIEFITKLKVPYIILEYSPTMIKNYGYTPLKLEQLIDKIGYLVTLEGFKSRSYVKITSLKEVININIYLIRREYAN